MTSNKNDSFAPSLSDLIKKEISNNNFSSAIELLLSQIEKDEEIYSKEIKELNSQISILKSKINSIEKTNASLIKEKNINLVKQYSVKLVDLLKNNEFNRFKEIVTEHDFPVNEFITDHFPDLSHMNFLHYCIDYGKESIVSYLVNERGADVNVPDREEKWTPLMYALQKQNLKVCDLLIRKGARVDYKDVDGFTPLSVAVDSNNLELVKLVLRAKPQIDNPKEIMSMAEPYENKQVNEVLKDYFGFQLILDENENRTSNTTPTNKLSSKSQNNAY